MPKKSYKGSFEKAEKAIISALKEQGFGILTEIDVQKTLKKKLNVDYTKYKILGACNPPFAYEALKTEEEIGLLLPCNVLVYEKQGKGYISIMRVTKVMNISSNRKISKIAQKVEDRLKKALEKATE